MTPIVTQKLRRHGFHFSRVKEIQKESLDDVFTVMTEGDLGNAVLRCVPIERTPAQT